MREVRQSLKNRIRQHAKEFQPVPGDFSPLLRIIGDARFVLIGEATHGTHEFYQARAEISKLLIEEKGFSAIAIEGDWPDAYRVNRYVQGRDGATGAEDALADFKRFPAWMWRNTDVLDFVRWLNDYNRSLSQDRPRVGFYGMDLYSLHTSIEAVIGYLDQVDTEAARRARYRYSCFDHFGEDPQTYGYAASFDLTDTCETEVVEQLVELRRKAYDYLHRDGFVAEDEYFFAQQNALVAKNAEQYYRSMFARGAISWNLRDRHMFETLQALEGHLKGQGQPAKIIVWAHNTHVGNAQATEMARQGELNVGQLVRQHYPTEAALIGFTTYSGTVTAASDWDRPVERKRVRPALVDSFEDLFHAVEMPRFLLMLRGMEADLADLRDERLERAIGVVYRPQTERISHYFGAHLMDQFDAVIHIDETTALEPLERSTEWEQGELPETYPTGL